MKTEIRINGKIKIILLPETNIEKEIFKELFSAELKVTPVINGSGEVLIEKQESYPNKKG